MIGESTVRARLCPSCANSIAEDAADCSYCKANLSSQFAPPWLNRDEPSSERRRGLDKRSGFPIPARFIWMGGLLVVALFAFLAGGYMQRSELLLSSQASLKQLQARDQMIQSQEAQLNQIRQQLSESSNQVAEMKTKLEESQKALSLTQQRLAVATREVDRLNASRSSTARRPASRAPDAASSLPQPMAKRAAEPRIYETTRATSLYENPSSASRVVSQISEGTRINVVSSGGGWLEVRSKRGNPPGYVRSDDVRPIPGAN